MADVRLQGSMNRGEVPHLPAGGSGEDAADTPGGMEDHAAWPMLSRLPTMLRASIPVTAFTVRQLVELAPGATIESAWPATEDIPLKAGQMQISWSEFEVVEGRMALRLTRLA